MAREKRGTAGTMDAEAGEYWRIRAVPASCSQYSEIPSLCHLIAGGICHLAVVAAAKIRHTFYMLRLRKHI